MAVETASRSRWLTRDPRWVAGAVGLAVAVVAVSWYRHATYRSTTYDLAVFEQAMWKLGHGRAPIATMIGWNIFADHLSPVLALFAPLYRLVATPLWFFAAQGIAAGAGLLVLPVLLDEHDVRAPLFVALVAAYVASPLLWNATIYDFHPTTLAIPFVFIGLLAAQRDNVVGLVAAGAALILLRDDLGAAAAALALVGFTRLPPRRRLVRVAVVVAGLVWALAGSRLGLAWGADRNWHFHYGYLGRSATGALTHIGRTIPAVVSHAFRRNNMALALSWLLPLGLLPLLRPARAFVVGLLGLPLFLSAGMQFHSPHFHYGAPMLPFLLAAAAAAATRLPRSLAGWPAAAAVAFGTAFAIVAWGPPTTHQLTRPVASPADFRHALALVNANDGITAGSNVGPRVADHALVLPFPAPFNQGRHDFPLAASVRHVSAGRAARIDIVIIDAHELDHTRRAYAHFLMSPYLRGFRMHRFGDVIVWRRERSAA